MALIDSETGEFITRNAVTLHAKIPHALHERIFEYANHQAATNVNKAIRDLLEIGIDAYDERQAKIKDGAEPTAREKASVKLWYGYKREHERSILKDLALSRDVDEKSFLDSCREMGFAKEAERIRADALAERETEKLDSKRVQRDNCGYWLRGVLQVKPDSNIRDLTKQGEAWNFSKQQITRALSEIGAVKNGEARNTTWRLPK